MDGVTRRAAGLGALTGVRSMGPAALLAHELDERDGPIGRLRGRHDGPPERLLRSQRATRVLSVLALGEAVADKLPWLPGRVEPLPLAARAVLGGFVGLAVADATRTPRLGPTLLGAAAALVGSAAAFYGRRWLKRRADLPDAALGLAEDAIVFAAGRALVAHGLGAD